MNNNPLNSENDNVKLGGAHLEAKAIQAENHSLLEKESQNQEEQKYEILSVKELVDQLEKLINLENAGELFNQFSNLKKYISDKIEEEVNQKKAESDEEAFLDYEHPFKAKFSALVNIFKEKQNLFHQKQNEEYQKNSEVRKNIIEKLKNLYTNTEPGTNLFKAIREIKEEWSQAGKVAKSEFHLLNNDYYHHLNGFYNMLALNKEYIEQEYAHNLEKRHQIISRAKELLQEPVVQKVLNELQYLHKLWREEAEPVAEEFRDATWEEFKALSDQINDRKSELYEQLEAQQTLALEQKNAIITEIKKLATPNVSASHNYWQKAIKKMEALREEFLKLGSVPRKVSTQNWAEFKQSVRDFNANKNNFYKNLKNIQIKNLEAKIQLIKIAQDNQNSEDWDTMVPLFKKLQKDWQSIGHVPRSQANKVWAEFREACNYFFNQYRTKSDAAGDDWSENYTQKKMLLEQLRKIEKSDISLAEIEHIKNQWNAIGKVPKDKIGINSEFNKALKMKLKLNNLNEYDIKEEGLTEAQITEKARKLRNQIIDIEAEIVKLENNLSFFSTPTRENPLLKDTFRKIDDKRSQLESLKNTLHQMIAEG